MFCNFVKAKFHNPYLGGAGGGWAQLSEYDREFAEYPRTLAVAGISKLDTGSGFC
jgi:hypothetical protein